MVRHEVVREGSVWRMHWQWRSNVRCRRNWAPDRLSGAAAKWELVHCGPAELQDYRRTPGSI